MLRLVDQELHESSYTKDEVCKVLDISEKELAETLLSKNTQDGETCILFNSRLIQMFKQFHCLDLTVRLISPSMVK